MNSELSDMPTKETQEKYYQLGVADGKSKRYPLWSILVLADEHVAAAAYQSGWRNATGVNLRFFREGSRR